MDWEIGCLGNLIVMKPYGNVECYVLCAMFYVLCDVCCVLFYFKESCDVFTILVRILMISSIFSKYAE